jgi:hypothetical protein
VTVTVTTTQLHSSTNDSDSVCAAVAAAEVRLSAAAQGTTRRTDHSCSECIDCSSSITLANALASIVLPVPGGPYSSTPIIVQQVNSVHVCMHDMCVIVSIWACVHSRHTFEVSFKKVDTYHYFP